MDTRDQAKPAPCPHHWRLAAPSGAHSKATCTKCGEQRTFPNSTELSSYGYGRTRPKPV
jgi:hypothetical protein